MRHLMITALFLMVATICTPQEKLEKNVVASGATKASNANISLQGTLGQTFVGFTLNSENRVNIGFWESVIANMSTSIIEVDHTVGADNFFLGQNYPNPADRETRIEVHIPYQSQVHLLLFGMDGRRLGALHKGTLHSGVYVIAMEVSHLPQGQYKYALLIENSIVDSKSLIVFHGQ